MAGNRTLCRLPVLRTTAVSRIITGHQGHPSITKSADCFWLVYALKSYLEYPKFVRLSIHSSSVGDMLDEIEWQSLETRREQSSLAFFYKIHSGTVSLSFLQFSIENFLWQSLIGHSCNMASPS